MNFGLIVWSVGIVLGIIFAVAVLVFNVQKWVVISRRPRFWVPARSSRDVPVPVWRPPSAKLVQTPGSRRASEASPWWTITFIVLALLGVVGQYQSTQRVEIETYNRFAEVSGPEPALSMSTATGKHWYLRPNQRHGAERPAVRKATATRSTTPFLFVQRSPVNYPVSTTIIPGRFKLGAASGAGRKPRLARRRAGLGLAARAILDLRCHLPLRAIHGRFSCIGVGWLGVRSLRAKCFSASPRPIAKCQTASARRIHVQANTSKELGKRLAGGTATNISCRSSAPSKTSISVDPMR